MIEIKIRPDYSRRAFIVALMNTADRTAEVALSSRADLSAFVSGEWVETDLGTYEVDESGIMVVDFTPPLSMPVVYTATHNGRTYSTPATVLDHGQYVWIKSKTYSDQPIGVLLTEAPEFSFTAETHVFYPLSKRTSGLGYGQSGVRRPGEVSLTAYTWTNDEAARLRNLIRDSPLCVQWPGMVDEALMVAPWYLLQDVQRTAIGPPQRGWFQWALTLAPVHQSRGVFAEVSATYGMVEDRGWPSYEAMQADPTVDTYMDAYMAAVALGGPPAPEGESNPAYAAITRYA